MEDAFIVANKEGRLKLNYGFLVFKRIKDAQRMVEAGRINFEGGQVIAEEFRNRKHKASKAKDHGSDPHSEEEHKSEKKGGQVHPKNISGQVEFQMRKFEIRENFGSSRNKIPNEKKRLRPVKFLNSYDAVIHSKPSIWQDISIPYPPHFLINSGTQNSSSPLASSAELKTLRVLRIGEQKRAEGNNKRLGPSIDFKPNEERSSAKALMVSKTGLNAHNLRNLRLNKAKLIVTRPQKIRQGSFGLNHPLRF